MINAATFCMYVRVCMAVRRVPPPTPILAVTVAGRRVRSFVRGREPYVRTRRMIVSRSVYKARVGPPAGTAAPPVSTVKNCRVEKKVEAPYQEVQQRALWTNVSCCESGVENEQWLCCEL